MATAGLMRSMFGLNFRSTTPIPWFSGHADAGADDVAVNLSPSATRDHRDLDGTLRHASSEQNFDGRPLLQIHEIRDGRLFRLMYADGTLFVLDRNGTSITGSWIGSATLADTMVYLLGPVAGMLLYLRGIPCLHASAVVVHGKALVFVGMSEAGKSTTAAVFAKRGYSVLTDDIAALDEAGGGFMVQPGVPRILLWPQSVEAIWGSADALPLVVPNWEKRCLDLSAKGLFAAAPVPLGAVYVLEDRMAHNAIGVSPVGGAPALMRLIANRYFTRFSEPQRQAREFSTFSRLAARIPVRCVVRPDDRSRINDVCDEILSDFDKISAPDLAFDESCV